MLFGDLHAWMDFVSRGRLSLTGASTPAAIPDLWPGNPEASLRAYPTGATVDGGLLRLPLTGIQTCLKKKTALRRQPFSAGGRAGECRGSGKVAQGTGSTGSAYSHSCACGHAPCRGLLHWPGPRSATWRCLLSISQRHSSPACVSDDVLAGIAFRCYSKKDQIANLTEPAPDPYKYMTEASSGDLRCLKTAQHSISPARYGAGRGQVAHCLSFGQFQCCPSGSSSHFKICKRECGFPRRRHQPRYDRRRFVAGSSPPGRASGNFDGRPHDGTHEAPEFFIGKLKPEVVVKGKEYETRINPERDAVSAYGGKLLFSSGEVRLPPST